jgi:hypothetical protein
MPIGNLASSENICNRSPGLGVRTREHSAAAVEGSQLTSGKGIAQIGDVFVITG